MWRYGTQKCNLWCLNTNKEKWGCFLWPSQNPSLSGAQGKGRGQASQGSHHQLPYPPPPKNLREKNLSSKKSLLQPLSYSRKEPTKPTARSQQKQIYTLRNRSDTSSYTEKPAKQKIALWRSQILHERLNKVKVENASS